MSTADSPSAGMGLPIVDGLTLPDDLRLLLRPGEPFDDSEASPRLPRWFYEVPSWQVAKDTHLTRHFTLHEFMRVDVREPRRLRRWPRYVPLAVSLLAAHLEILRLDVGTLVWVAANGGHRSPAHERNEGPSPHCWGTAADIHRIGGDLLDTEERIRDAAERVRRLVPGARIRPFGHGPGETDDHLHVDIGRPVLVPGEEGS